MVKSGNFRRKVVLFRKLDGFSENEAVISLRPLNEIELFQKIMAQKSKLKILEPSVTVTVFRIFWYFWYFEGENDWKMDKKWSYEVKIDAKGLVLGYMMGIG